MPGAGHDAQTLIAIGALLELLLIIANVGTAVVPFSIYKRVNEAGAVGYVTARLPLPQRGVRATRCVLATDLQRSLSARGG